LSIWASPSRASKKACRSSLTCWAWSESTIQKWLDKGNKGVHHVAFCIEDGVANALAEVSAKGVRLIDEKPRKGAEQLNIAFLHPKSTCGILTELCEHPE